MVTKLKIFMVSCKQFEKSYKVFHPGCISTLLRQWMALTDNELFAGFFSSVFNESIASVPDFDFGYNLSFSNCVMSPVYSFNKLKLEDLDINKGAHPDDTFHL